MGDTITDAENHLQMSLLGYKQVTPMVYCGIYPADGADYATLQDALSKLQMNDASLVFEPETSAALGYGFRCGFLGLLHMEIIQERGEREFDLGIITTVPNVIYEVLTSYGETLHIDNPGHLPPPNNIELMREPFVFATIYTPQEFVGTLMDLCQEKRGVFKDMQYEGERVRLNYDLPLNEVIYDFFDPLKSRNPAISLVMSLQAIGIANLLNLIYC